MEQKRDIDFSVYFESYGAQLPPELVSLFYYDICFDHACGNSFIYDWSKEVQDYLYSNAIIVRDCQAGTIPQSFEDNKIYFTFVNSDNKNKATAFFRHLRNSFAHYSIGLNGNNICMEDHETFGNHNPTMKGKIDYKLFKGLIDIFFKQKAIAEDEYNKCIHRNF